MDARLSDMGIASVMASDLRPRLARAILVVLVLLNLVLMSRLVLLLVSSELVI